MGVVNGVFVGGHFYFNSSFFYNHLEIIPFDLQFFLTMQYRCYIGYALLLLTRMALKKLLTPFFVRILPESDVKPERRYAVEIPTKFITYSMVGFNAAFTAPYLHHLYDVL